MEKDNIQTFSWSALEYTNTPRSNDWYWAIGLVAFVSASVAVYFHNYSFGIFIILAGTLLIMFNIQKPREINYEIKQEGINILNKMYLYKELRGFTVIEGESDKLLIELNKYFLPIITIPLPENTAKSIRASLSIVLPELELKESQSMKFVEKIGL